MGCIIYAQIGLKFSVIISMRRNILLACGCQTYSLWVPIIGGPRHAVALWMSEVSTFGNYVVARLYIFYSCPNAMLSRDTLIWRVL